MNAEIVTIGDEILIGQITDTNAAFIGSKLTEKGVEVQKISSVKDDLEEIVSVLKQSSADFIILTGGLGPTRDDVTKKALCLFFEDELKLNSEALKRIENIFKGTDLAALQANRRQALLPQKCTMLPNEFGTAPGMWFEENGKIYVSLPGVPVEMKHLLKKEVLPRLVKKFTPYFIEQKTLLTYGIGESALAEKLSNLEDNLPKYMSLAYLPAPGSVRLRLTARGEDQEFLNQALQNWENQVKEVVRENYGGVEGKASLAKEIAEILTLRKWTLATAESFTGGKIASLFTEMPGASAYYRGGMVPYDTKMKVKVLGVPQEIIEQHSVVSREVAHAMAERIRHIFQSDFAIATTGNAGPTKGDSDAEIGTAFLAIATPDEIKVQEFKLGNVREKVVKKAILKSLEILKLELCRKCK